MAPIHVGGRTIFGNEATAPAGAGLGDEYYNSAEDKKYIYNGLAGDWQEVGSGSGGGVGDSLYDQVTLHIPGNTPTLEVSRYGHTITNTGGTSVAGKFGNGIELDDTDNSAKNIKVDYADGINMGTLDFTMEGWVYINSDDTNINLNYRIFQQGQNSTSGYGLLYTGSKVYFGRTDETLVEDPRSNWNNKWVHFAITRSAGTLRLFRDGVMVDTTTSNAGWDNNSSDDLYFGVYPSTISSPRSNIVIDDIRFTKGTARYTGSFVPPTEAFPQYKQTSIGTSSSPAQNAQAIYNEDTTASAGTYFINAGASGTIRTYCEFNSFGGWMLIAQGDGDASSPIPTGSQEGTMIFGGGTKGRLSDTVINNMTWTHCWLGMTDNDTDGTGWKDGRNTMDSGRQLFTTSGNKFNVAFNTQNATFNNGTTDNGRNQGWSYKGITGNSGSSLAGSPRQPVGAIQNGAGTTDRNIGNTNTYGISPHEAGDGGAWIFAGNGTHGSGNFNNGFGADHNNVSWTSRYCYWMVR